MASIQFDNVDHAWLWLLLLAAGAWALFAIYRGIFERTEHKLTWALMLLRAAGLLALVLALAKPTFVHRSERVDPGTLAVVLDNSVSMSLAEASGKSRYTLAKEAVGKLRSAVEAKSGAKVQVELFDINGVPITSGEPPKEPRVERTDLVRAVSQTTAQLRSKSLVGVVLISDGVDNTGRQDLLALNETPSPIYAIGFREDPEANRLDLAVRRVEAPKRVIVNNTVKVGVLVEKIAGPATEATVTLKRGVDEFVSQKVSLPAGQTQQMVTMNFTPSQAGSFVFTTVVAAQAGEKNLANNAKQFPLQVDAEPIRVFYVEGFLRFEYKFLKNRFEDDPDVSLVTVVRRVNPDRTPAASGGDLITPERLKNFEVVILGDMEANYLTEAEYQALVKWVDAGHSLLVIGGYQSFGPAGFRATPLADALPVVFADKEPFQSEDAFVMELTDTGKRHPMFEITGDRVKDAQLWSAAPQLQGAAIIGRAKPAAEILAVNPNFVSEGKPLPVAVVQRYGAGHTMVLAVDTTWRWSRLTRVVGLSDTLFSRFWSQAIRWLSGRDPDKNRPPLVVNTDRPDYDVGKQVAIRATRQPRPDLDLAGATVSVEVAGESGKPLPVQVKASSTEPDVFTGTIYPSAGGRYQVTATLTADGKPIANQTTEFLVHGSDLELADTRPNRAQMQSIAANTGGVYADVEDAEKLADKIERKERRTLLVSRTELWNSPYLFLFFLGAITAEWVIRRRNHLV